MPATLSPDRQMLLDLWSESWQDGIWIAAWSKAVSGLTPAQAAWTPAPGRHSIWQNVTHVCFWREYTLTKVTGRPGPGPDDAKTRNFELPTQPTDSAWTQARQRLETTHKDIAAAIADTSLPLDRLKYHLAHDAYHLGQIMQLRALQGMAPIE